LSFQAIEGVAALPVSPGFPIGSGEGDGCPLGESPGQAQGSPLAQQAFEAHPEAYTAIQQSLPGSPGIAGAIPEAVIKISVDVSVLRDPRFPICYEMDDGRAISARFRKANLFMILEVPTRIQRLPSAIAHHIQGVLVRVG
jgi:hypothetical protein